MMQKFRLHPIIIKLYLVRNELFFLEKYLDDFDENSEDWPSKLYDEMLVLTDTFHRIRDKAIRYYNNEGTVDNLIYLLDKMCGEA